MAGMWPWVPKKLLKWEKAKKNTFSFKADFVHFFCKKVNFLTAPAWNCCSCGQFYIGVTICVWWLTTQFEIERRSYGQSMTYFRFFSCGGQNDFTVCNFFSPTRPSGPSWSSSRDVCLFVGLSVCLMSPFHVIFLRGRTGAELASSVDWCDLDLE